MKNYKKNNLKKANECTLLRKISLGKIFVGDISRDTSFVNMREVKESHDKNLPIMFITGGSHFSRWKYQYQTSISP